MGSELPKKKLNKLANFISLFKKESRDYWTKIGEREILKLFHTASHRVPAYKDFLEKNKINPKKIKNLKDFLSVPPIDKNNYLRAYPYEKLAWDGNIKRPTTIHSTSGSTGEPTYFQRDSRSDLRRELIINNFFRYSELTINGPTLFIITFSMGIWSAGMGIYTAAYLTTNRNKYHISIVSPGISKVEVLKILKNIAPNFKQVIVAGYPPFVKDVIDDALQEKIDIKNLNLRFVFTGEAFSEEFRDYIAKKAGVKNVFIDTMNTYGTSEFGATAVETPLSILVRRLGNKKIFKELFGDTNKVPTLAQYIPNFLNFECVDGELFLTGDGPFPLIRYRSGDSGGVLTYQKLEEVLSNNGIDIGAESEKLGISEYIYKLPLVFVYERKNLTTTIYGVLIYPEFLKVALLDKRLSQFLTGKFTMIQKYDKKQNQYLEINLELKKYIDFKEQYEDIALKGILKVLLERSSEFRELCKNLGQRVYPKLIFWPYEHQEYFTAGMKQKWVKI